MKKLLLLTLLCNLSFANENIESFKQSNLNYDPTITIGDALDSWDNCKTSDYSQQKNKIIFKCDVKFHKYYFKTLQTSYKKSLKDNKRYTEQRKINPYTQHLNRAKLQLKGLKNEQISLENSNKNIAHKETILQKENELQQAKNQKYDEELNAKQNNVDVNETAATKDLNEKMANLEADIEKDKRQQQKDIADSKQKDLIDKKEGNDFYLKELASKIKSVEKEIQRLENLSKLVNANSTTDYKTIFNVKSVVLFVEFIQGNTDYTSASHFVQITWKDGKIAKVAGDVFMKQNELFRQIYSNSKTLKKKQARKKHIAKKTFKTLSFIYDKSQY